MWLSTLPHCLLAIRFHKFPVTLFNLLINLVLCICLPVLIPRYITPFESRIIDTCQKTLTGVSECNCMCTYSLLWSHAMCCSKSLATKEGASIVFKHCFYIVHLYRADKTFCLFCKLLSIWWPVFFSIRDNFWDLSCLYCFLFKF